MTIKTYYMGFFRYDDAKIWNKTNLNEDKKELEEYLNNLQYVDFPYCRFEFFFFFRSLLIQTVGS